VVLRFCPPEIGVLVAKQKHDSGRKKLDQRRSKEKRDLEGRRGVRATLGKGGDRGQHPYKAPPGRSAFRQL